MKKFFEVPSVVTVALRNERIMDDDNIVEGEPGVGSDLTPDY